ncbi:hypothetical protein KIKIMORA_00350 [Brevundimonas phage vB_BpoS-Kikimora]|uniref:Uncharacterized protein n=1 Tax=Brevundimonas phage vB_BpoS-Kikimora TaxID=2948601 RepID=A0A9E7MSC6_9CAUD|nr:hypothetical protein KIKIMORA_00350 [Brevundimonas phage vB_BpoS-Kikimora]
MTDSPSVAWACLSCNSPRAVDPCPKCGTALTKPADGWEWPETPDVNRIRALAREVGYAVGVHGTLERDLDLIAVPWVADAVSPFELAQHIAYGLGGAVLDYKTQDKPCGRWSCNINADGWFKLIDLSVMPPIHEVADENGLIDRLKSLSQLLYAEAGEKDGQARQDDLDDAGAVSWAVARLSWAAVPAQEPFMYAYRCVDDAARWKAFRQPLQRRDGTSSPGLPLYTRMDPAVLGQAVDLVGTISTRLNQLYESSRKLRADDARAVRRIGEVAEKVLAILQGESKGDTE